MTAALAVDGDVTVFHGADTLNDGVSAVDDLCIQQYVAVYG